jgi:hypothetical protein
MGKRDCCDGRNVDMGKMVGTKRARVTRGKWNPRHGKGKHFIVRKSKPLLLELMRRFKMTK